MNASPTLPSTPLAYPTMDYAFLRREGMQHLERMAGQVWTDFNAENPGITMLEQLCYTLTDLAYHLNYELPAPRSGANAEPYDITTPCMQGWALSTWAALFEEERLA